jgi:4'-phosphopantetheinyl transferase EntD
MSRTGAPSGETGSLKETLLGLLPSAVALAVWEGEGEPALYPEEEGAIARAVAKRGTEFRRGRACARAALAQLGVPAGAIPVGVKREPLWPAGYIGSITHCAGLVAAVAAPRDLIAAVGLDAEPARPLPEGTERLILNPVERQNQGNALFDTAVFTAKEAIHKALFPLTGVRLDFLDVVVRLDRAQGRFLATPAPGARRGTPRLLDLVGSFAVRADFVLAACHIPSAPEWLGTGARARTG